MILSRCPWYATDRPASNGAASVPVLLRELPPKLSCKSFVALPRQMPSYKSSYFSFSCIFICFYFFIFGEQLNIDALMQLHKGVHKARHHVPGCIFGLRMMGMCSRTPVGLPPAKRRALLIARQRWKPLIKTE